MQLAGIRAVGTGLLPGDRPAPERENSWRTQIKRHDKLGRASPGLFRAVQRKIREIDWQITPHLAGGCR